MSQAFLFYHNEDFVEGEDVVLQEDTAKHIVQVLRKNIGDTVWLTNGRGAKAIGEISLAQKKKCHVSVIQVENFDQPKPDLHLAVAFTKNSSRNEWVLEKVTELGVSTIISLQAKRSERNKFRYDRWENIILSALTQSQQFHLPKLQELTRLHDVLKNYADVPQKLVAHCMSDMERLSINDIEKQKETLLLIGPEGDFTEEEINALISNGFKAVSLGNNRLRTETAAVTACAFFNMINHG